MLSGIRGNVSRGVHDDYIITIGLIAFLVLGAPVAISLGLSGLAAFFLEQGTRMNVPMIAQRMMYGINNFLLLAIPLFILAARLMNTSGVTGRLFNFATTVVGFMPGGLGHANCVASLIFAGMSGAASRGAAGEKCQNTGVFAGAAAIRGRYKPVIAT